MDAAVQYLLENLGELLRSNLDLILNMKQQVEYLNKELRLFKALLKESNLNNNNAFLKELEKQIREVLNEAEDAVEMFLTYTAVQKARSKLDRFFHGINHGANLLSLASRVQTIRADLKTHFDSQVGPSSFQFGQESERRPKAHEIDEDKVVGFEDEAENIFKLLSEGPEKLEVISITGMPGLGKTTLAKMIFRDPKIKGELEFSHCAWAPISQNFNRNKALLDIMGQLTKPSASMRELSDDDLSTEVCNILKGEDKKYLIVLDDVWENDVWTVLKSAFPENNNKSKILLTSRVESVAKDANPKKKPYHLRYFRDEESLKLLLQKALGSEECIYTELTDLGLHIAQNCNGLPLAIVVIGGILREKGTQTYWWEKVSESVNAYLDLDREKRMEQFVAMSFDHLPYHLKVCFLYFGMFSGNFQISVSKLIRLWIAEGLIERTVEMRLEDIAEDYLEELINRNLVQVAERRSNGRIKTCHVHDKLREFCKRKAEEVLSFCEIKEFNECVNSTSNLSERYRRLGIHSCALNHLSFEPYGPYVRSLLFFPSKEVKSQVELVCSIPEAFKLLRVLEGQVIKFHEFPDDLSQLIHLRYLRIYFDFTTLPSEISHFLNMQTLIIDTSSPTFEIKADIWNMIRLRHLQIYASTSLQGPLAKTKKSKSHFLPNCLKPGKDKNASSKISTVPVRNVNLQTLSTISPESCTKDVFDAAPNLKKLGIRGQLSKLVVEKGGSSLFDNLGKLTGLNNLKLVNDASKLAKLPHSSKFPQNLNKITLSGTRLKWVHMSTLGLLPKLRILKLKDNAFEGDSWKPDVSQFRGLTVLYIEQTDLVSWEASADHFPSLRCIYLKQCNKLNQIPVELADVQSLQLIDLYDTQLAAASAREIQQQKLNQTTKSSEFELSIYPQDQ